MSNIIEIVRKLADREAKRSEADIQAGIRDLLLQASLDLDDEDLDVKLESQLGDLRRIDVEVGSVVIEVKKDLRKGKVLADAIKQLSGYVEVRTQQTGQNYIGILSDGLEWRCFHLKPSKEFVEVSKHLINASSPDADKLIAWLDGVLATKQGVIPTPEEISSKLGVESSSYAINHATLLSLYEENKHLPTVQMKRLLWAKLLTTALGSQFQDSDELFVEHTLLVNVSEIIAHAVLGLNVNDLSPASLLSGSQFETSGIYGVVESDFFDWVIEVDEGDIFIRSLARKISRFNWGEVSYDIMKVLYESIIDQELRKQLGEYYTPDWLAEVIVEKTITDPLNQRVLDPSCGSGTFLFHAVKNLLKKAEQEKLSISASLAILAKNVIGFDIHPVAVTLARVTYLLAIGRDNLMNPARGEINIPVYLADSMQWRQKQYDLWSMDQVIIEEEIKIGSDNEVSSYHSQFSQGAIIVPKVLLCVEEQVSSPLGLASGRKFVKSKRSAYEKKPWINLPDLEGTIESEFIKPVYTGASILPFRCQESELAVIPWNGKVLMDGESELIDMYLGLCDWWRKAEELWMANKSSSTRLSLIEQIDYMGKLTQQFPIAKERILYATSGMHICSARLSNRQAIIDSNLYWATTESKEESYYLCSVLNAEITTIETRPFMSYGKDERHVCKHVWQLKIPKFSSKSKLHLEISKIGQALEKEVAQLELRDVYFANIRQDIRKHIRSSSKGKELEKLVEELLLKGFSND